MNSSHNALEQRAVHKGLIKPMQHDSCCLLPCTFVSMNNVDHNTWNEFVSKLKQRKDRCDIITFSHDSKKSENNLSFRGPKRNQRMGQKLLESLLRRPPAVQLGAREEDVAYILPLLCMKWSRGASSAFVYASQTAQGLQLLAVFFLKC